MNAYVRCGKVFAVYVEFARNLGPRPVFAFKTCKGETIIDVPYTQVILTPSAALHAQQDFMDDEQKEGKKRKNAAISETSARVAKDRS